MTNCQYLYATGNKMQNHKYYRHSTRPGNLHVTTLEELIQRKGGGEALRRAVSKMLPKNSLRKSRLARLKTVEGSDNPYAGNITAFWDDSVEARMNDKAREILKVPKA